ncbi:hypothetical protein, partial [Streptomyces sp. NPDC127197]|uniref:hypothetical protein n=1 Tax=Streptomyces sp. NPDC127197 TaxID=3345388 RepID=UPI0036303291
AVAPHEWDGVPAPDPERAIARLRAGTAPQPPPNYGAPGASDELRVTPLRWSSALRPVQLFSTQE